MRVFTRIYILVFELEIFIYKEFAIPLRHAIMQPQFTLQISVDSLQILLTASKNDYTKEPT